MTALLVSDILTIVIGIGLVVAVSLTLRRGLGGLWGPEKRVTQATVRMVTTSFWLAAAAVIMAEGNMLPGNVPNPLCGLSNSCGGAAPPTTATDVIVVVITRFGIACVVIGALYLVPVLQGLRWRRGAPSPTGPGGNSDPAGTAATPQA